jgi:CRP-like cAMP-binding protein
MGRKVHEEQMTSRNGSEIWTRPPWHTLSQDEIGALSRHSKMQTFERHRIIFRQGDPPRGLHCILAGDVLLDHLDEEGNHTAFRIAVPGDLLGFRSLFAEQPHAATARALRRCRVNFLPEAPLRRLLGSNPRLGCELLKLVAADPGPIYAPLLRSPWLPAASRLAHLLLILHRQYAGNLGEGEATYELPVSMGNIAALIGIRRETVSRLFQQLEKASLCSLHGSRVVIPSTKRLIEYSGAIRPRKPRSTR